MKESRCPNCGAQINSEKNICAYCGAIVNLNEDKKFEGNTNEPNLKAGVDYIPANKELASNTKSAEELGEDILANLKTVKKFRAILLAILPTILLVAGVISFTFDYFLLLPYLTLIPMISIGVLSIIIIVFIQVRRFSKEKKVGKLLKANQVDQAFQISKRLSRRHNYSLAISVLIAYYLKKDYAYCRSNVSAIENDTYQQFDKTTNILMNIANRFDYFPAISLKN